jgi:O-antigen/teichoic acid export membrane protein
VVDSEPEWSDPREEPVGISRIPEESLLKSSSQDLGFSVVNSVEIRVDPVTAQLPGSEPCLVDKPGLWINKGGLALLDQGLISGSNFVLSLLLARWLTPDSYGVYALAFGIYVLLQLIYGALVLEPMAVFGGAAYRQCLRQYCRSLLWTHLALAAVICVLVGGSAAVTHALGWTHGLPGALLGVALASPCLLLLWFARRAFYLEMSPARAATGSILYCVLLLSGLFVVYRDGVLSPFKVFILMGAAALLADVFLLTRLRAELPAGGPAPVIREIWRRHWRYGRWALASCVASWTPTYIFYPLLSTFSGVAQSGELRALMNFFSPLDQTLSALALLFLPYAARIRAEQGYRGLKVLTRNLMVLSLVGAGIYWGLIIEFREPVFRLLYAGKYAKISHLVPVLALGSMFWSAGYGPAIALRAIESPYSIFVAYLATTLISVIVGIPATRAFGLKGAVWASNASEVASFLILMFLMNRKLTPGQIEVPIVHN